MFLGIASIFSGFYLSDIFIGNSTDVFIFNDNTIMHNLTDFHIGILHMNLLGLYYSLFGICWVLLIFNKQNHHLIIRSVQPSKILNSQFNFQLFNLKLWFNFLSLRWYINYSYNVLIAMPILRMGYNLVFLILDQGYLTYLMGQMYVSKLSTKYTLPGLI